MFGVIVCANGFMGLFFKRPFGVDFGAFLNSSWGWFFNRFSGWFSSVVCFWGSFLNLF